MVASTPEEAARLGRRGQRERPHLLHPDWGAAKLTVMLDAVRAKFTQHAAPRAALMATMTGERGPLQVTSCGMLQPWSTLLSLCLEFCLDGVSADIPSL